MGLEKDAPGSTGRVVQRSPGPVVPIDGGRRFDSLQAGRALAALAVVLHHAVGAVRDFVAPVPEPVATIGAFGYLGVDFFFVLSGFIIFYTNAARTELPGWARHYAQSRVLRVYLPYWAVSIVLLAAYIAFPSLSAAARDWDPISSFLLLPSTHKPILSVGWTLQHEVIFYAIFLFAALTRRMAAVLAIWVAAILGFAVLAADWTGLLKYALHPINLEFIAGIAVAWCVIRGYAVSSWAAIAVLAAGVALFAAMGFDRDWSVFVGIGLAVVVSAMVRLERDGKIGISPLWVLLGDASYAVYLVHLPLLSLTARLCAKVPALDHWAAALAVGILASIAAGLAFHLAFERPLLARLHAMPIFARKAGR